MVGDITLRGDLYILTLALHGKGRGGVRSPFSGCVKSETGKKRPSAKIDGTRSRALRGATEAKSGVKSGGFWQPLSQDVALVV